MIKKKWIEFPKIWKSIKHSWKNFWYYAKYTKLDAGLCIITLGLILFVAISGITDGLWGAAGILLVYSYGVVIRLGNEVEEKERLKEILEEDVDEEEG